MVDSSFIKQQVRESVESDVVGVAYLRSVDGAGWFGVPRQVFCYVDFLGSVAYNNVASDRSIANTRKAVRFIDEYFPRHYRPFSNLLVAMWRHGTVHGFIPYQYYTLVGGRKFYVRWSSNNDWAEHNQAVNLKFFDVEAEPDAICLAVNACALASDLLGALDRLIERMNCNPGFERACVRRLNRALAPRYIGSRNLKMSSSVRQQIAAQIAIAKDSTEGILRGDQVNWYRSRRCLTSASSRTPSATLVPKRSASADAQTR